MICKLCLMGAGVLAVGVALGGPPSFDRGMPLASSDLTPQEQLGKLLFFDENLSTPVGQSCAACHGPEVGFTGPISSINETSGVYPGAVHKRFGNRKPPAASYASFSPDFYFDEDEGLYIGGQFWDGRADNLVEQAKGPFLNPLEQNNPNPRSVIIKVALSDYADLFEEVYGPGSLDWRRNPDLTYELIAEAIAAYEASSEVNQFTSKYDYYLAGMVDLTDQEMSGLELFNGKGMCNQCHPSEPGPDNSPPLFTDFTYDNLGLPRNPENPFYWMPPFFNPDGPDWVDLGLGAIVGEEGELGKMKVPTLRNVDKRPYDGFVKAFGHNGVFKSLEDIVHFYNTRDVEEWPPPEVPINVNTDELGNLGLTPEEEEAIVAFLRTLNDGFMLP
ncbi:MAG: cytochrome-c peroxidase [Planctomycetota bacterium]|jgi:cytochrome c peroxidase